MLEIFLKSIQFLHVENDILMRVYVFGIIQEYRMYFVSFGFSRGIVMENKYKNESFHDLRKKNVARILHFYTKQFGISV